MVAFAAYLFWQLACIKIVVLPKGDELAFDTVSIDTVVPMDTVPMDTVPMDSIPMYAIPMPTILTASGHNLLSYIGPFECVIHVYEYAQAQPFSIILLTPPQLIIMRLFICLFAINSRNF